MRQSLKHNLLTERERWVLWLPIFFAAGIGVYFGLNQEPPTWVGFAAMASLAIAWSGTRWKKGYVPAGLIYALLILGMAAAGFAAAQIRTADVAAPMLSKRTGPATLVGQVSHLETFPAGSRITLRSPRISGVPPHLTPSHARIRLRGDQPDYLPGDWIRLRAILTPPSPPAAPGAFDFQRQSYFRGLGAVGFGLGRGEVVARNQLSGFDNLTLGIAHLRQAITKIITQSLTQPLAGVAAALMTGERSAVSPEIMQALRDSGLAHLLSISGLHIGLVAGILFTSLRAVLAAIPNFALRYPIKKWAATAALAGALAYALIAGATLPTQRAFLMAGLALLAVILDRRGLSIRSVACAALIILALQPESLLGASFQMSFAAVTALIATYEVYRGRRKIARHGYGQLPGWLTTVLLYLGGVLLTTFVAGMATAPFAIFHFNRFAEYGLAANLVAVPVTALWVMPWAIVSFLLMPFGLQWLSLEPMSWGPELVISVAQTVAAWPGAVAHIATMPTLGLILIALGGSWLCLWRGRWRFWGVPAMACGLLTITLTRSPDVLVDGQGKLLAVRTIAGEMMFSSQRRSRFEQEIWLRISGNQGPGLPWPDTGLSSDGRLSCDSLGCLYRANQRTVALVHGDGALIEDCWSADVVISTEPIRSRCPAAKVIDRFSLWRHGGHALWLNEDGVRVESVNGQRGLRPWSTRPSPHTTKPDTSEN